MRVLFIHGLESSPLGTKAQYLAREFETLTPAMDTSDFPACVALQVESIAEHQPQVVVGSSFGGMILLHLTQLGAWRGPCLFLAQAGGRLGLLDPGLPPDVPAVIVHGTHDEVIPVDDSRALARTGSPELVRYVEVDDQHRLVGLVESGRLAELVREAAALAGPGE
jgi:pimeloyl-ACP methyl ester carboxylesterase